MRHERVKVTRDGNTVHNRTVPPWEIPVLEFLFDPGNVEPTGEFVEVKGRLEGDKVEYPDASVELARLVKAYGSDPKSGIATANSVFGNGRRGVTELRKLIDAAKAEETTARQVKAPKPVKQARRAAYEPAVNDSLLS
jgi:hypothetical protein